MSNAANNGGVRVVSWDRTERTLRQLQETHADAETQEQCQTVGALARDALISLAQAVFRPDIHWRSSESLPSATDSKRQLEAYVSVALAGGANEEARSHVRSAIQLAVALTHKRTATPKDAKLVALVTEFVVRLIALLENHHLAGSEEEWHGVYSGRRYFAWDGPQLHALPDRPPIGAPLIAIEALKAAGHIPSFGLRERLHDHQARGQFQVYETDRLRWRKELLNPKDGSQVLLVQPAASAAT